MNWRPIVVGVDGSPESIRAATFGTAVADLAGTDCRLIHAAPDYWAEIGATETGLDPCDIRKASTEHARTLLTSALSGFVPRAHLDGLSIRIGRAPHVLREEAHEADAEVLVLGGKHHRALVALGGSTVTHIVRAGDRPVLATNGVATPVVTRVLCAVDLSHAAKPTIDAAEKWAGLFGAHLRVLHVVEPVPVVPGLPLRIDDDDMFRAAERRFETAVTPLIAFRGAETVVRRGRPAAAIVSEAEQWHADLIVVGSHGKGWVDRLLIGSTSERLLHVLLAPTLVVPVGHPVRWSPAEVEERREATVGP